MKTLHLDSFEKEINDRILERGCEYYLLAKLPLAYRCFTKRYSVNYQIRRDVVA